MNEPFFSVIVPAHNAACRIRKGLGSIKRQTFTNYELIIVCDDCQDDTAAIAREYTKKVFEVDWHNCGKTRNKGLDEATGEWILFMDDDDWLQNDDVFRTIYYNIQINLQKEDFDVLAFGFTFGMNGYSRQFPGHLYIAIWNKAWKRSFIGNTRFPEVPHSDDVGFAEQLHPKARFRYIDDDLYYYNYLRPGSITAKLRSGELKTLEQMGLR
jgi:glycosyltransferase involved in cell wall biosynthesis